MSSKVERKSLTLTIEELLGDSPEVTRDYFQCDRNEINARILIPEHQRYYVWPKSHQESLIDSIMKNFPMPLLVFTEYVQNNKQVWDVQDGQQRLTTIQKFIEGEFQWNGKHFAKLNTKESRAFLGYQIACSIIKSPTDAQVADIFERLNKGKTLSHNDKFYNRKNEPIIDFTINTLKSTFEQKFKRYTNLNIKKKQRTELSDVVGAVISICSNNVDNITTSYERIGGNLLLNIDLTDEKKTLVINTFNSYFNCIEKSMETNEINKPKKCYLKLSNMFGIWLYWYLKIRPNETIKQQKLSTEKFMWFASQVQHKDKGKIFKDLDAGAQRNLNSEALEARTTHLLSINIKKELIFEINEEDDDEGTEDEDDEDDIYEECRLE